MTDKKKDVLKSSKLSSRLRMMANGDNIVNTIRSITNPCVVSANTDISKEELENVAKQFYYEEIDLEKEKEIKDKSKSPDYNKGDISDHPPKDIYFNVYVQLRVNANLNKLLTDIYSEPETSKAKLRQLKKNLRVVRNWIKLEVKATSLEKLKKSPDVVYIEGANNVVLPPEVRFATTQKKARKALKLKSKSIQNHSKKVIIGIIDVGGFDFAHKDFLNKRGNKTRFDAIWDQGGTLRNSPGESLRGFNQYDYGSLIQNEHMNTAIKKAKKIGVPIHSLEPQSQNSPASHATHVASIAAGNSGICNNAEIVGVLISLPDEKFSSLGEARSKTFTDSSRITDAVDFLIDYAEKVRGDKPISINISLGTNGHAHDGSSPVNRWIDARLTREGRCLCVAAGNAGQEKGVDKEDFGYIMGRIHTSGRIPNKGLKVDLEWQVVGSGILDVSENELEIWYKPQDRFSVMLKPPGLPWIGPVLPQKVIENKQLKDKSFVSIYNRIYHQANGSNQIGIYLSPNFNLDSIIGIRAGIWKVRLIGEDIRDGSFDAWIERDDPYQRNNELWSFPSFFTEKTNVDNKSINSLACGFNVIAVGNYDANNDKINITSSQGPSRDNRLKPEIVAPGTDILAASGFTGNSDEWTTKTGTSMASPYACGVAGLLLARYRNLTSAQISGIYKRTCSPVAGLNYEWKNDTGFGVLDISECLKEADAFMKHEDITKRK